MLRRFPSVYQLLPTAAFCRNHPDWLRFAAADGSPLADAGDPIALYRHPFLGFPDLPAGVVARNLDLRNAFDAGLGTFMPPNTDVLYGVDETTECNYFFPPQRRTAPPTMAPPRPGREPVLAPVPGSSQLHVRVATGNDGDGTVPARSGSAEDAVVRSRRPFSRRAHAVFPDYPDVIDTVCAIVRDHVAAAARAARP